MAMLLLLLLLCGLGHWRRATSRRRTELRDRVARTARSPADEATELSRVASQEAVKATLSADDCDAQLHQAQAESDEAEAQEGLEELPSARSSRGAGRLGGFLPFQLPMQERLIGRGQACSTDPTLADDASVAGSRVASAGGRRVVAVPHID